MKLLVKKRDGLVISIIVNQCDIRKCQFLYKLLKNNFQIKK